MSLNWVIELDGISIPKRMVDVMEAKTIESVPQSEPSLWLNKNFLFLWFGNMISNFGFQVYMIALPLLIYDLSQSALAMSTMRAIEFFPNIFIGMIAGVIVDRFSRKLVMSITTFLQMGSLGCVIFFITANQIEVWHLYILGFVLSAAGYTFGNSHHSVIPQLVSKQQLTDANAKLAFMDTLIRMSGPGIAGFIIAIYSFEISFSIFLGCLILLFLFIQMVHIPPVERAVTKERKSVWVEIREGIDALIQNKTLLTPTIITIFTNLAASLVLGVLIFFAADTLQATEKEIGFMFSMGAIGGLIGSLCITKLRKHFGRGKIYVWALFIECIGLALLIFASTWWLIGLSLLIRTFSVTMSNIVYFTIRQEFTPNHLLGRVAGTSSMMMKLALPLGLFLAGLWAEYLPVQGLFILSTILLFSLFLIIRKNKFVEVQ
jgi:MFS family permease